MVCVWLKDAFIWLRAEISIILRVLYSAGRLTCAVIECGAVLFVAPPWSWCTASNHGEDVVLITGTKVSSQTIPASVQLSAAVRGGRVAVKPDSVWCEGIFIYFFSQKGEFRVLFFGGNNVDNLSSQTISWLRRTLQYCHWNFYALMKSTGLRVCSLKCMSFWSSLDSSIEIDRQTER